MGLDIYHNKAVLTENPSTELIYLSQLSGEKESLRAFVKQDIRKENFSLAAVFSCQSDLETASPILKASKDTYDFFQLFGLKDDELFNSKLKHLENIYALEADSCEILDDYLDFGTQRIYFDVVNYHCSIKREVLYSINAGHQRKGMKAAFFEFFENDSFYTGKEYFYKLEEFLDSDSHMFDYENFLNSFLNNYEEGRSFLSISW